ncbi:hypothetical protein HYC85_018246 [Camellia sinensis]|uniref:Association with the SNF1 complex (ASC) domain-containing protein n=1 Tax=Camellia sinensis TaxID=4442 RepID=A0A7J7GTS7_CAMSI|nr:hypothetical protein HYC85_018246 [Camellia sinensis]
MGNVNGREDGAGAGGSDDEGDGAIPSQVEIEEGGVVGVGAHVDMTAQDGAHVSYHPHGGGELMGHSPPPSPRAAHSPLMFTPQVPVVPLQRPDEINVPSPSWMQTSSGFDDMCSEQGIPTMITWSYDGNEVAVEGSWDDWKIRKPLQRSGKDFTIMKVLPSGVYQYRFIVDGQCRIMYQKTSKAFLVLNLLNPQNATYNNLQLGSEDFAKEPPLVPPHLQMTLLNVPTSFMEIPPPFSRPQHVVLNHLYMQKGRSSPSVVALGSTHRFVAKYATVVLYKYIQR